MQFRHSREKLEVTLNYNYLSQCKSLYSHLCQFNPIMLSGLKSFCTWCSVRMACCLAAPPYQVGVRAIKSEVRRLIACAKYSSEGLEVVLVFSGKLMQKIGVRAWVRVIGVGAWALYEVLGEKLVTKKLRQIGKRFEKLVTISTFISSSSTRMSITSIVSKPSIIYQLNIICQVKLKISELLFKPIISSRSIFYAFGSSNYNFDTFFIKIGNIWGRGLFFISSAIMLSLTIYLTLLAQGIERQPGPVSKRSTLSILTYNCNGLGDPKKLKRLLLKLNVLVNKGCIVFLQETHIVDTKYLEMIWKHSFLSNCIKTNSAGVIILYNKCCS